jgi:thiamine pyrophosphate-dependent acetolactate synthase large subunit-like protein
VVFAGCAGGERMRKSDRLLDVPGIDYCGLARRYGVRSVHARSGGTLSAALTEALKSGRPALIEVETQMSSKS